MLVPPWSWMGNPGSTTFWQWPSILQPMIRYRRLLFLSRKVHTRLKKQQLTCSWFPSGTAYFCRKRMLGLPGGRCVLPSHSGRSLLPPRSATRWCRTWTRTSRCPPDSSLPSVPSAGRLLSAFPTLLLVECQGQISEASNSRVFPEFNLTNWANWATVYVVIKAHASIKAHRFFAADLQNFFSWFIELFTITAQI